MKSPSNLLVLSTFLQIVESLSIQSTRDVEPRVVNLPIRRSSTQNPVDYDKRRLRRRDGTLKATVDNMQTLYFLNATMGTPPQELRLHLDTGSSDLWVNTDSSRLCNLGSQPCEPGLTYSANSSTTYGYINSNFNISYVDGSGAAGDYATDTLQLFGKSVSSLQFGIGYDSSSAQNIVGIGYPINEAQVARRGAQAYQNLPAKMVAEGLISTSAYSLWLNDLDADTGNVLFGGIDTAKYQGNLVSVPIQQVGGLYSSFFITMTGLDVGSQSVANNVALGVLLDSGSSLTYLPDDMATSIYKMVGATYSSSDGAAFIPCSARNQKSSLTFKFSSPASVTVAMSEMVLDLNNISDRIPGGAQQCLFGIVPTEGSNSVLGDTFLRSAYVVYELSSNEIALANSKFNVTESNVVEITKGAAIPSAIKATNPVSASTGLPIPGSGNRGNAAHRNGPAAVFPTLIVAALSALMGGLLA